ncbi:hypothetical protein AAFF_G00344990 [Aldrovandia affinis]|uniref:TGF-beta activated kinase 1 (MAP3K7) binding protein 3 n=1 Tax=Aldrovandia affinis TaxID=143900 RepID=A0AAD7R634_9TELE|nr:hypothetical protein AAFF_G00344990 [Aldrovandia affinis]
MAQGGPQLDYKILHDLKQRFPEIPEGVVSQCLLQNNNNLDVCRHLLAQESNRYLYEEYHSTEEGRLTQNHMLHINLGYPFSEGNKANGIGGRPLVHSSSDGHLEPQRSGAGAKKPHMVFPEPHSAPATMAPSPGYNPFFINEQGRSARTSPPHPAPAYSTVPRYTMSPIMVTLSQNISPTPQALQIPGGSYGSSGNTLYIRPALPQTPQPLPWPSPVVPVYQPSLYSSHYTAKQIPQTVYPSRPPAQFPSPYSSPQHQIQQSSHVLLPISPPTYQQQQPQPPVSYLPYLKNHMEIPLEGPQRPQMPCPCSSSPAPGQQGVQRGQNALYISTSPSPGSPSRVISLTGPAGASFHPGMYIHQGPAQPHPASSPQPGSSAYTFKIKGLPSKVQRPPGSPTMEMESLLNMVDQVDHPAAPAPILPISILPGNIANQINHMPRRYSSGSDDYAYTQALLLHQRARMERLVKELLLERQKLEQLNGDVNDMEYDLLQRRFHRVNNSSLIPRPDNMTRLRSLNRQLQIDIDCTLKETDLLQSRGKFDPKAMNNFYDNIQPGPVVPPKPLKKGGGVTYKPGERPAPRDEDFEGVQWNCESCTFLNHPALNRCEQCEMPRYT